MKKILAAVLICLIPFSVFAAVAASKAAPAAKKALPAPTAVPTAIQTATATATPKLSAIEMYRQMTGKQREREFPTATATAVMAVVSQPSYTAAPAPQGMTSTGWFIIAADAALTGWAVFSTVDFNNSVDAYERLKTQLNVPPYDNYDFLIREQEKANSKMTVTVIAWSLAGVCIAYTAADLLWLHSAFPVKAGAAYNPKTGEVTACLKVRF